MEKFHEVKEATRTATKPLNGTTPTTSASASPVAARSAPTVVTGPPTTDNQVRNYTPTPWLTLLLAIGKTNNLVKQIQWKQFIRKFKNPRQWRKFCFIVHGNLLKSRVSEICIK